MHQQAQKMVNRRGMVLTEAHSNVRFRTLLFRFRSELLHFNKYIKSLYIFVLQFITEFGMSYAGYESIR